MRSARLVAAAALALMAFVPLSCVIADDGDDDDDDAPPTPDATWAACNVNSECVLAGTSCCGTCGAPTLTDVEPINRAKAGEHGRYVCPKTPSDCPECPTAPNPALLATCRAGACAEIDVRRHEATACSRNEDCRLRATGCCECGGSASPYDLIAVHAARESLYAALVCDPQQNCDQCAPVYSDDVEAYCETDGHCAVRPVGQK